VITTILPTRCFRPVPKMRSKSDRWRIDETDEASSGEAFATLVTAGLEDCPPCSGRHPISEAMLALPAAYFGLIGPFHKFSTVSR
jgi:hypothetical protein